MLRWLLPVLVGVSFVPLACGSEDEPGTPGSGGTTGAGGAGGETAAGAGNEGCAEDGTGTLVVNVTGLPDDVLGDVTLSGPAAVGVTETTTFDDASSGTYSVSAARVYDADPIVRTVYDPVISEEAFCLAEDGSHTITVAYAMIPSSNKLWSSNANGDVAPLLGFGSDVLSESGDPDATVAADAPAGPDLAFDKDGNLWTLRATLAEPSVLRYPAEELGASGEKERDIGLDLPEIACLVQLNALAFDPKGNLWLSSGCDGKVVRIPARDLTETSPARDVESDVQLSGLTENHDLAFDGDGNLWLALDGKFARFDAARLGTSDSDPADRIITAQDDADQELYADFLTFDAGGNLWGTGFGRNDVFQVSAADLAGTGEETVTANVTITIGVTALLNRPAFDDAGALWLSLSTGSFGALTSDQLGDSSGPGSPTTPSVIVSSPMTGSYNNIAFFPAASGLPLYHAQP